MAKRTNYQQEKRSRELEKLKKKEAKKEKKLHRDQNPSDEAPDLENGTEVGQPEVG